MRNVQWPVYGDFEVFRRSFATTAAIGVVVIMGAAAAAASLVPALVWTLLPLTVAVLLLFGLWSHGHAQDAARRAEIVKSFAGLTVLHDGQAIRVSGEAPLVGEFDTRRAAARAAIELGHWAVIVRAYDHYYLLAGARTASLRTPVAFRTYAVADIVPAILGDQLTA